MRKHIENSPFHNRSQVTTSVKRMVDKIKLLQTKLQFTRNYILFSNYLNILRPFTKYIMPAATMETLRLLFYIIEN